MVDSKVKLRSDLINHLIKKHGYTRYLEIGVQDPTQNFDKIDCTYKVSVDPDPKAHATFCKTSDEFFKIISSLHEQYAVPRIDGGQDIHYKTIDLIFIDGLHTAEQVSKDLYNAMKILSPKGIIVLHDCNPLTEELTIVPRPKPRGPWHGDVYKFVSSIVNVKITVDIDCGCMVVPYTDKIQTLDFPIEWEEFNDNRELLLNLVSWDKFVSQ